jgi:hypothetical protein
MSKALLCCNILSHHSWYAFSVKTTVYAVTVLCLLAISNCVVILPKLVEFYNMVGVKLETLAPGHEHTSKPRS